MPNDSNSGHRHPAIRTYLQMRQTSEQPAARPAQRRKTIDTRQQAAAPATQAASASTVRSMLLIHAENLAAQEMQRLAQVTQGKMPEITEKFSAQCKRKNGRKDDPELAACKKFLLSAGMNMLAGQGVAPNEIIGGLDKAVPAQHVAEDLLRKLPEEYASFKSAIGQKDWDALARKPGGYALLALLVLKRELAAYSIADLVRCAKSGNNGQELVALTNKEYAIWIPEIEDRIRIAANSGGWKNLEAAKTYLDGLFRQRARLEEQGLSPQQVGQAMAPFTIKMETLVHTVARVGGSNRLRKLLDSMNFQG